MRLLGVSLHPLCFVLELAPHGSLASVIEELSAEREARAKQQDNVVSTTCTRESMLGREMSYKIAFQVNLRHTLDGEFRLRRIDEESYLFWRRRILFVHLHSIFAYSF